MVGRWPLSDVPQQRHNLNCLPKKEVQMATYPLPEVRRKWSKGELILEQVLGHVVQHLLDHLERLSELEKRLRQLEQPPAKPQP